jgi:hypothetical protein
VPEAGDYLLTAAGFSSAEKPFVALQKEGIFYDLLPLGKTLTLELNTSQRYCTGWRDIATGERHACPDKNQVAEKYEECPACQKRTGFNPAFYHAASISAQQEARNSEPHFLYLAHFGPGLAKVGISYAARGRARLLEQGARSALILDTFPTAVVARSYEANAAALPNIAETVQLKKKITGFSRRYDETSAAKELQNVRQTIEGSAEVTFAKNDVHFLDPVFFPGGTPDMSAAHDCSDQGRISGAVSGMLGTLLFCRHQDTEVFLPLKKYTGYRVRLSYDETPLTLPAQQIALF